MCNIMYSPDEVWKRAVNSKIEGLNLIAEDDSKGVEIYVGVDRSEPEKTVIIYVFVDGITECSEEVSSPEECEERLNEIYSAYLSEDDFIRDEDICDDKIAEREDELDQAVMDFLATVLGEGFYDLDSDSNGEIVEDCKEHFLEYIARKFSISIYRPMYLEDEDGTDFYTDTPYEDMVFDDEDNPIYK